MCIVICEVFVVLVVVNVWYVVVNVVQLIGVGDVDGFVLMVGIGGWWG